MTNAIASQFESALIRIHRLADWRGEDAKTEIKAMGQFARRSIGQRVRFNKRVSEWR